MDGDLYSMEDLLENASLRAAVTMVVVLPYDSGTLKSINAAHEEGIINPILVGDVKKITESAKMLDIELNNFELIDKSGEQALEKAAALVYEGEAAFIMKGMVSTGEFIHTLLDPRWHIRTERILSHVAMFEIPYTRKIFLMSDAAINILPNFNRKIHIVANAVDVARSIGFGTIRVAMIAAVEKVKLPAMPATLDAFLMKKYAETGYFGKSFIDGPFAFDNAIDPEKARKKGITGKVAGYANILIVPNIETGNVIWKTFTCIEKRHPAGVVMGGRCPIVVPSRADDWITKLRSIKFARLLIPE